MRTISRLSEVIESLNPRNVNNITYVNLRAAMRKVLDRKWIDPTTMRNLERSQQYDPSPHLRELAGELICHIQERNLTQWPST